MSAVAAELEPTALPGPGEDVDAPRPSRLRALARPARRRRPRIASAIVAVAGALAIGAAQMGLSIMMTQGGYEQRALLQEQREMQWERQTLADELAGLSSPQFLAANAAALGMVIDEGPTYLRLSDGAVLGEGVPASWHSSVDAIGRGSVANSLVATAPLVTLPEATMQGIPQPPAEEPAAGVGATLPPSLAEGLPSPVTR